MNINQHDLSDDELDYLFRDSAEKMDFDFEPDSWTKMSQKLNAVNIPASGENQVKNIWLKRGLSILLALLFIVGGYYLFTPSSKQVTTLQSKLKNDAENESKSNDKKYVPTDKIATDNLTNEKTNTLESKNSLEKTTNTSSSVSKNKKSDIKSEIKDKILVNEKFETSPKNEKNIITKNENSAKPLPNQSFEKNKKTPKTKTLSTDKSKDNLTNSAISDSERNVVMNENDINNFSGKSLKREKSQKTKVNSEVNATQTPSNQSNVILNQTPNNQIVISILNPITTDIEEKNRHLQLGNIKNINAKNGIFKANFQLPIIAFESPKIKPVIPISSKTSFQKGLYFRAAISPDFSVVLSNSFAKIGNNGALLLEYRFNKHWSLQSGIIRSLKRYIATPEQYNWNTNWNNPTPLVFVDATCKMLDIPLNIRYDITQKVNSRLFVCSGFTSYIMLKEDYYYNYKDNTNPNIKYREWSTKTGNYPFSVLNFSLGYERKILRKLSFQAEPFVKIPLGEVGYGKVKLATIGVFFSAKYPIAKF
jgi:hypothetical protein